jgi:HEAT repeat protein
LTGDPSTADRLARRRVVAVAGHDGDAATARAALADTDPSVRATALRAMERAEALTDDDVRSALSDPAPTVRRRALTLAAQRPDVAVHALLDDPDPMVVEVACWVCGEHEHDDEPIVARLSELAIGHEDALIREAAVAALGAIGSDRGLPAILHATGDKATVRRRAVLALAPFAGADVEAALERARSDRDWQVRQAAEDVGGPATPS